MNDEELKQRINYLVEHGGIWDDPLADIRRHLRIIYGLIALAVVIRIAEAAASFL